MAARKREAKLRSQKHNYTLTEVVCSPEMLFRYLPPATLKIDHPTSVMVILTGFKGGAAQFLSPLPLAIRCVIRA